MNNFFKLILLFGINSISAQNFTNEITILQNETKKVLSFENEEISLKKIPFKIQFTSKFHNSKKEYFNGLKLTIAKENSKLVILEEGTPINLIPFFEDVTIILPNNNGFYSTFFINSYAHHYLFYENEVTKNVQLILKKNDTGLFELEIDKFNLDGKEFAIENLKENKLTFIFLNDYNLNKIIDSDELRIVKINFN